MFVTEVVVAKYLSYSSNNYIGNLKHISENWTRGPWRCPSATP